MKTSRLEGCAHGHTANKEQRWDENLSFPILPRFLPLDLNPLDRHDHAARVLESPGKGVTTHRHWDQPSTSTTSRKFDSIHLSGAQARVL